MPNYQYLIKETKEGKEIDTIVDINFSIKYVNNEKDLPIELLEKISYVDKEGNKVIGTKLISQVALSGFNSNGTSKGKSAR